MIRPFMPGAVKPQSMTPTPRRRVPFALVTAVAALALLGAMCRSDDKNRGGGSGPGDALSTAAKAYVPVDAEMEADLKELTKAPHVLGSPRQTAVIAYLEQRLGAVGTNAKREPFTATVPNPAAMGATGPVALTIEKQGVNLYGLGAVRTDAPCVVAIGSHFDTKHIDGLAYVGANDSGSSTVAVLQILKFLKSHAVAKDNALGLVCDIVGVLFDGEEATLANWHDGETIHPAKIQDNTHGSRAAVARLTKCSYEGVAAKCLPADLGGKPLVALVLMDMIGSPGIQITRDAQSSPALIQAAAQGAADLGNASLYDKDPRSIDDDHVPYRKAGVAAIDLIDFNNTDYWHRPGDELSNISYESIALGSRLALLVALRAAAEPKVFLQPAE